MYTADSSTYVVIDLGSTTLAPTPSFCANASVSISTVTNYGADQTITTAAPADTTTVYQQASSSSTSVRSNVVADNGFEDGSTNPFNASASGSGVTAQIIQAGPLRPYSGHDYL